MSLVESLLHFFTPRHTNNHRAKALHLTSIFFYITALLVVQMGLTAFAGFQPGVLGYASNISVSALLTDTNTARAANGAGPLTLNSQLSTAANNKAADMFANQYWAHVSPSGKDPWSFITAAGYNFLFAGENLARDFADSQSVVTAWMNSPSHRENLLNTKYQDVGFAVVNGKYGSNETTLVVQMFGTRAGAAPTVAAPEVPAPAPVQPQISSPSPTPATPSTGVILNTNNPPPGPSGPGSGPQFSILGITRGVSTGLILFLMVILLVDGILVYKRRVVRLSGHNLAHLLIFMVLLIALNILGRGVIL